MSPIRPSFLVHLSLLRFTVLPTTCSPSPGNAGGDQNTLRLVEPHAAKQCIPVKIIWTGGVPPFNISITPEPAGSGRGGINPTIKGDSREYCWTPSFPSGASAHINIIDSTPSRLQTVWGDVTVDGSNTTCMSHSTSSLEPSHSTTSEVTTTTTPPVVSSSSNVDSATGTTSSLPPISVDVSASVRGQLSSSRSESHPSTPTRTSHNPGPQSMVASATSPAVTSEAAGSSSIQSDSHLSRSRKALSSGAISGIVLGTITLLVALVLLIYCTCARRRREDLTRASRRSISPREAKFEQALAEHNYTKRLRLFEPTLDIGTEVDRVRSESAWSLLSPVLSAESRDDFHSVDTHESFHTANSSNSK
ncbi:hypothetical protein C8Q74DRAFT_335282 [Fomes fomentarius]|nr:hypothetical protein C8Q74DRAFT_335282 [Fomes fomentarius]